MNRQWIKSMYLKTTTIEEHKKKQKKLTCISLFTGCGGAALGIREAGFEIRVMVEWDKAAIDTLKRNWTREGWTNSGKSKYGSQYWHQKREPAILNADITKLSTTELLKAADLEVGEATMLEGGFPCQGFSSAGKRMINDPRNKLYKECVRVIREALPRTFMLENVPGLISMKNGEIILQIVKDLAACGYSVTWDILNAADYGVPQNRKRVFIMGNRIDVLAFSPKGNHQLHMGGSKGRMYFPEWYLKKYSKKSKEVAKLIPK